MKQSEILIKAKGLIDTPEKWTQGEFARSEKGLSVQPTSPRATCFCSVGAIRKIGSRGCGGVHISYDLLSGVMGGSVINFNDTHTHAEVMAAWDEAIKIAREKENEGV